MPPKKGRGTKREAKTDKEEEEQPPQKKTKEEEEEVTEEQPAQDGTETAKDQPIDESKGTKILEKGHIYFLYRPKMDTEQVESPDDVQKVYMLLKPYWQSCESRKPTLIILGRKKLPEVQRHSRYWGYVAEASDNMDDIAGAFKEHSYETKTRGERTVQAARPVGEGVYQITTHKGHSHLVYILTLPDEPHDVQKAFNIDKQASIVINVKNPDKGSPPSSGLPARQKAEYPENLKKTFMDRRFVSIETSEFFNYNNCELVLVGGTEDVEKELGQVGQDLEKMEEKDEEEIKHIGVDKKIFDDLELERKEHPVEPLKGDWA